MKQVKGFFKNLDFFSVPFSPAITDDEEFYHKSIIGGFCSIAVLLLSGAYAVYMFILWQNLQLLPTVTQQYQTYSPHEIAATYPIQIQVRNVGYNADPEVQAVDPFDPKAIVFIPLISEIDHYYDFQPYEPFYGEGMLMLNLSIKNDSQPVVTFVACSQEYLLEGQECASAETVRDFYNQIGNQLYLEVYFNMVNPEKFEVKRIKRTYSLLIMKGFCTQETIYLQLTRYQLDEGFLIDNPHNRYFFTDSTDQSQLSTDDYCSKLWLQDTIGVLLLLRQDSLKVESMAYPKISEILAQIGSIVSLLFMIKYIIIQINHWSLRKETLNFFIQQYYPEINQFKIERTRWFKSIKSIYFREKQIDVKSFEDFRSTIRKLIASKLNYMNLVYEMSRMQIILNSIQKRYFMRKSHFVGIRLKLQRSTKHAHLYNVVDETRFVQQTLNCDNDLEVHKQKVDTLQIADAVLLGLQSKKKLRQFNDPNEEVNEFYELNKVL